MQFHKRPVSGKSHVSNNPKDKHPKSESEDSACHGFPEGEIDGPILRLDGDRIPLTMA